MKLPPLGPQLGLRAKNESLRGRKPLMISEILELELALMKVFRTIRELKGKTVAAKHIKYPQLPAIFSESIAVAATKRFFGPDWTGRLGGRVADVVIENSMTRQSLRVEVKATGRHAFQELKEKDLRADFLIWIRFGLRIEEGAGSIDAVIVEKPGRYFSEQRRLDTRRFEAVLGVREVQKSFRFESLSEMLRPSSSK